ncbi:aspartic proteinase 36-like [Ricinus communis]|uniref:aspartic proteinase 36-like n=1 Tax=Ricinus communis TaxID=3988 RepID=UPI00201B20A2|nr:aspartic proteinase 36-like [Ricinus communis]
MNALSLFLIIYHSLIVLLPYNGLVSLANYNHLHPNARMPLYGDILSYGYYATKLYIGTPPQEFTLVVDTGSNMTFVPCCGSEEYCGKHEDPAFQTESSSTYQPVNCHPSCDCDYLRSQCSYKMHYGDGSYSRGVLAEDIISFGNESEFAPQRLVFGCELDAIGSLYSLRADGIIGLGRGRSTIVDQLVDKGVISDSFSLCYGGMEGGGHIILGSFSPPPSDMFFTYSNPGRSQNYNVELMEIQVAGKPLELNPTIFNRSHGTILDSGTTFAFLPENAFIAFKNAILSQTRFLKRIEGPDPNVDDICFSGVEREAISNPSKIFPEVNLVFSDHQILSLSPENYLFQHRNVTGSYCLGIYQNKNKKDQTTNLGGIIVRNTLVTYDRQNNRIGFWKTNCSELWKRLDVATFGLPISLSTTEFSPTGERQSNSDMENSGGGNRIMHDEL